MSMTSSIEQTNPGFQNRSKIEDSRRIKKIDEKSGNMRTIEANQGKTRMVSVSIMQGCKVALKRTECSVQVCLKSCLRSKYIVLINHIPRHWWVCSGMSVA